jgi:hypothetical protein
MEKENLLSVKSRKTANPWSSLSISEFLQFHSTTASAYMGSKNLIFTEELKLPEPEKELTEKQLFTKIKKEIKEVKKLIN